MKKKTITEEPPQHPPIQAQTPTTPPPAPPLQTKRPSKPPFSTSSHSHHYHEQIPSHQCPQFHPPHPQRTHRILAHRIDRGGADEKAPRLALCRLGRRRSRRWIEGRGCRPLGQGGRRLGSGGLRGPVEYFIMLVQFVWFWGSKGTYAVVMLDGFRD